jgi:hypothetical protein
LERRVLRQRPQRPTKSRLASYGKKKRKIGEPSQTWSRRRHHFFWRSRRAIRSDLKETRPMTRRAILGAAFAALTLTSLPSNAQSEGRNTDAVDNFQTTEQFRANWNRLLDKAAKANVQRSCADGLCYWDWQLRAGVKAKMVESHDHTGQAFYCFQADPAPTWDCYGNGLNKWVWNPPGIDNTAVAEAPSDVPIDLCATYGTCMNQTPAPAAASAPASGESFSVPLVVEDGGFKTTVGLGSNYFNMTVDTGATSGLVTESIANSLIAKGLAREIESGSLTIADGSTHQQRQIIVHDVTLDRHTVHDVKFAIGPDNGVMLLGLVPLAQFGRFTIDAQNGQMLFN